MLAVLPALAGIGIAWQQAVNGRVRAASGSAMVAGFVNFVDRYGGPAARLHRVAVVRGLPGGALPTGDGGSTSADRSASSSSRSGRRVVRYTGVLLLGLGMISGQVTGPCCSTW